MDAFRVAHPAWRDITAVTGTLEPAAAVAVIVTGAPTTALLAAMGAVMATLGRVTVPTVTLIPGESATLPLLSVTRALTVCTPAGVATHETA